MFKRLRKWLAGWLSPIPSVLVHRDESKWTPRAVKGVLLECVKGDEVRLLGEYAVKDSRAFWRVWSALNMADVRWDDGERFAPLD